MEPSSSPKAEGQEEGKREDRDSSNYIDRGASQQPTASATQNSPHFRAEARADFARPFPSSSGWTRSITNRPSTAIGPDTHLQDYIAQGLPGYREAEARLQVSSRDDSRSIIRRRRRLGDQSNPTELTVGSTEKNEPDTHLNRRRRGPPPEEARIAALKSGLSETDLHETDILERLSRLKIVDRESAGRGGSSSFYDESRSSQMKYSHGVGSVDSRHYSKPDRRDADSNPSASDSDLSTCVPSLEPEHPFYRFTRRIIREVMHEFRTTQKGANEGNCTADDSRTLTGASSAATSIFKSSDKRKLDCRGDDDEEQSLSLGTVRKKLRTSSRLTFACPFCKKDPSRYRTCYRYILSRIRDVKQHISRCHRLPVYCPSCMDTFETEALRDEHSRARSCPTRPVVEFDGVTEEQKKLLARRISSRLSEEEQWYAVFDILFVGHPRPPSPYIDQQLSEEMHGFRDFALSQGPRIIRTRLGPHVSFNSPDVESDLETFQDYIYGQCLQRIFEEWERNPSPASSGDASHSVTPPCRRALTNNRLEQVTGSPSSGPPDVSPGSAVDPTASSSIGFPPRRERERLPHQAASSQPAVDSSGHTPDSSALESSLPFPWSTEMTQDGIDFSAWEAHSFILRETDVLLLPETCPERNEII